MSHPIEDYAMIGDGETAALVHRSGSIDWLCLPRFDSDACFAALLGHRENGCWRIGPEDAEARISRRYRGDTLILETEFTTEDGSVRLVDFMPMRERTPSIVRQVIGLAGEVPMRLEMKLRFDYGRMPPWAEQQDRRIVARIGADLTVLHSDVPLRLDGHDATAQFTVRAGQTRNFSLRYGEATRDPPPPLDIDRDVEGTERYWLEWIGRFDKPTSWPDAVRRSLITLKALINRPTGGMVAAATTSLPEVPGGSMNWDYRFCWLRDAAFTLAALLNAGYHEEAQAWRDWILRAIAGSPEHIQIMYRLDGGREIPEWKVDWLDGYDWATPVNVGNNAARQRQLDVHGELIDVLEMARRAGIDHSDHAMAIQRAIVEHLETNWTKAGHGIWESRGRPRHYVYSKVMAWVAIDRFLKLASMGGGLDSDTSRRLQGLRADIHREVCENGYDSGLESFVQYYGGQEIDAALLLLPTLGFLPANDPRVAGTIARVEQDLVADGLVYRNQGSRQTGQGAFLACSCWLADAYQAQGRKRDARKAFERMLAVRNDLGLLSEQYNLSGRRLAGNFPQALSHLALVTTALGLSGSVLQRGGG